MSLLKQNLVRAAAAVAVLFAFAVSAQAQEVKIGVVDIQALLERAPQTEAAMGELAEEFAPRERELAARAQEYQDLAAKFQQDQSVMGETERQNATRELRDLEREVSRLQNDIQEDYNLRRNEKIGELQRSVIVEVRAYAQQQGYDLVVADGIVFASTAVNITEEVLRTIEANYQANNSQ